MFKCSGISVARGNRLLLSDVVFNIGSGECLILKGPNGLGKTSLLRTIANLQPLNSGVLECDLDEIVYSSHADGMKATLTVLENMRFWKTMYSSDVDLVEVLEKFNLSSLANRYAGQLSAGQKRRLGLSRLLISQRRLWVMDEPTVSLDVTAVAEFVDVVRRHLDDGGAALVVTHIDINIGDRVRVLDLAQFVPTKHERTEYLEDDFL